MEELISVIIPVYNVEAYLDDCMDNVVNQSYKNLEIILVDDGATDFSGVMCDQWQERDPRVRVIHKTNGGLSSARNAGLAAASGDYITFVDSDDLLDLDICKVLYEDMHDNNADIAICDASHIFDRTQVSFPKGTQKRILTKQEAIEELWYQKSFLPSVWGKLYRKKVFQDVPFTQGIHFEDLDIMHLLLWQAERIVYRKDCLYGYVHRENSITTGQFSLRDMDIITITEKILTFAQEQDQVLIPAAEAYAVTAAMRIELNAPQEEQYAEGRKWAHQTMERLGKKVLKDRNIRKKTYFGLMLYFYCRPLMNLVYKKVNRWK